MLVYGQTINKLWHLFGNTMYQNKIKRIHAKIVATTVHGHNFGVKKKNCYGGGDLKIL